MGLPSELPSNAPRPGDVFAGDFVVDHMLGVGGMGFVFAATQRSTQRRVAIKMLLPDVARNPVVVSRFMREARTAGRLENVHSARVYDVGAAPDGTPYLVMEYLEGIDLKQLVQRRGRVPETQAVDWVLQACEAIAEAHQANTIHRDLKPANLFLASAGGVEVIKVLDFGISKTLDGPGDEPQMSMTRTSEVLGSPYYMSPEQLKSSRDVDARADIWGLGIILYELLRGSVPFDAPSLAELTVLILATDAPRLTAAEGVSPGLAEVVARCLQKDASQRFSSVAELATAIAPFGSAKARVSAEHIVQKYAPSTLGQTLPLAHGLDGQFGKSTGGVTQSIVPAPFRSKVFIMSTCAMLLIGGVVLFVVGLQRRAARIAAAQNAGLVASAPAPESTMPLATASVVLSEPPTAAPAVPVASATPEPGPAPATLATASATPRARPAGKRPRGAAGLFGSEH